MGRLIDYFFNKYPYTDFHELNADWLISTTKEMLAIVDNINSWKDEHEKEYHELKQLYDDLISGNFTPEMIDSLYKWTVENTTDIIGKAVKTVFFGLTDDGHFISYIPDSWNEIEFNTSGYDITLPSHPDVGYGHLVLSY